MMDRATDGEKLEPFLNAPWTPVEELRHDRIDPGSVRRLAATLDRPMPERLPALWHWLAFVPEEPTARLSDDGHPPRGGLLPPLNLPRRMYAGGAITLERDPLVGETLERRSIVDSVVPKQGRSGPLVFVEVRHELWAEQGPILDERQTLVYRPASRSGSADGSNQAAARDGGPEAEAPPGDTPEHSFVADEVLLFRFSAVTFNAHRIHYDAAYAREVEGHRHLVVHGPLLAMQLAGLAEEVLDAPLASFEFRGSSPAYVGERIDLTAHPGTNGLLMLDAAVSGRTVMTARARARTDQVTS